MNNKIVKIMSLNENMIKIDDEYDFIMSDQEDGDYENLNNEIFSEENETSSSNSLQLFFDHPLSYLLEDYCTESFDYQSDTIETISNEVVETISNDNFDLSNDKIYNMITSISDISNISNKNLETIIIKIYANLYKSLTNKNSLHSNLYELISDLNVYFFVNKLSGKKFPDIILTNDYINNLYNELEIKYYTKIKALINLTISDNINSKYYEEKIDDMMIEIEEELLIQLFLTSQNNNLNSKEYWGIDYDFIVELSNIFNVGFNNSSKDEAYFIINL